MRRDKFGDDHPDTLTSASRLAAALREAGDYQRARALDEDTLARRRQVLGEALVGRGLVPCIPAGPILPVILGSEARALAVADGLRARGLFIPAIRPPTVPVGSSRLRITLSSAHQPADLARLLTALAEVLA